MADKGQRVQRMFQAIAPSYDLNNRVHSLGRDQAWRRAAVRFAQLNPADVVVDVACGTGDLSLAFSGGGAGRVVGVDFAHSMLQRAAAKRSGGGTQVPRYLCSDAQRLPLPDACADVVSIAFGIRNVVNPALALCEFHRILRPGGRLVILEFSMPTTPVLRQLYTFYFKRIMPRTAALLARDRTGAYRYLPRSVDTFLGRAELVGYMEQAGFTDAAVKPLTLGVAVLYRGIKVG